MKISIQINNLKYNEWIEISHINYIQATISFKIDSFQFDEYSRLHLFNNIYSYDLIYAYNYDLIYAYNMETNIQKYLKYYYE